MPLFLYFLAFAAEIVSIIGYYFARNERTLENLYYLFIASSAVILEYFLSFILLIPGGETIVLSATATTSLVVEGIYYYTATRQPDIFGMMRYLFPATLILFVLIILGLFLSYSSIFNLFISIAGALLFSLYLYYDLGRLMRGQVNSPARMAWMIYLDILLIFKFILRILIYSQRRR